MNGKAVNRVGQPVGFPFVFYHARNDFVSFRIPVPEWGCDSPMLILRRALSRHYQLVKPCFFLRAYRNNGHCKHFAESADIDFHSALFRNINHIECKHGFCAELTQLKRQIKAARKRCCIGNVNENIRSARFDKIFSKRFLNSIAVEAVNPRQIRKPDRCAAAFKRSLSLVNRNAGAV